MSEAAQQARQVETYGDFDGICFIAKIGIKKGEPKPDGSNYPDKNVLLEAVTPDHKQWHSVEQQPPFSKPSGGGGGPAPASGGGQIIQRPEWSRH